MNFLKESTIRKKQPPEVFYKKGVLKNFAKFTGEHLCFFARIRVRTVHAKALERTGKNVHANFEIPLTLNRSRTKKGN